MAVERPAGLVVSICFRSGARTLLTTNGSISSPSLAIAADTIAICRGLAATSYCPIALSASWASFSSSGNWLATPPRSARCRLSKPNGLPLLAQFVLSHFKSQVGERGIAGDLERLGERDLGAAAVGGVGQVHLGTR